VLETKKTFRECSRKVSIRADAQSRAGRRVAVSATVLTIGQSLVPPGIYSPDIKERSGWTVALQLITKDKTIHNDGMAMWRPERESLGREALEAVQLEGMRATLERVLGQPNYARRLAGAHPHDVARVDDWARLPFLTKEELRDAYPFGLACGARQDYRRIQMSSGTTGNPILNPYTAADIEQWGEVMARCYVAAGVGPADAIQITPSFGLFTGGFGFHYGAEKLGAMVIPTGAGRTSLQLRLMRDLGTTVIVAIATYPLRLLEVAREEGLDLGALALRVGIFGSEMWSDELRVRIERELGIQAFDLIGMTETGGPGLGIDCEDRTGIHVWEDHYYVEIVDPATGRPLPDGREGELIVSTLTRQGLPLVRYRTHDLTRVVSRAPCACGRTALRLDRLRGRTDDMVIYKGVNFYPQQVEMVVLRQRALSHEYQIVLDSDGGGERMTIHAEAEAGCDPALTGRIQHELRDLLGISPEVRLCAIGELPRREGKAVRVIDRRTIR
jgi:phenylacetate-CoA ligase